MRRGDIRRAGPRRAGACSADARGTGRWLRRGAAFVAAAAVATLAAAFVLALVGGGPVASVGAEEAARADDVPSQGTLGPPAEIAYPPDPRADWYHVLAALEALRAEPPAVPLVVLLGGSCGRECTLGDDAWAAEVAACGGPAVVARNLSSRNKTFRHDLDLVRLLPPTSAVVFVGVNLGRFTVWPSPGARGPATLPAEVEFRHAQHHYDRERAWTAEHKEREVGRWLRERWPVFERRCDANLVMLEHVVRACLERGFRPVLLELPRNEAVVGGRFDTAVGRYRAGCARLSAALGVPYVDFLGAAGLASSDFYDLAHVVDPGRAKWQRLLAETTVEVLGRTR